MLKIISLFGLLFAFINILGQENRLHNNLIAETKVHYGFLLPHHPSIAYSVKGHIPAIEVNVLQQSYGKNPWDAYYNYPRRGLGLAYYHLRDHQVYGSCLGLYGIMDRPFLQLRPVTFSYRLYGGLAWLTKVWDLQENHLNLAIGTHINLFFRLSLQTRLALSQKLEWIIDGGMAHFSNGNIKKPNLGLNVFTANMGLAYKIGPSAGAIELGPIQGTKKVSFKLNYLAGRKAVANYQDLYYYKSSLNALAGYNFNPKRQLGLGFSLMYDGTQKYLWAQKGLEMPVFRDMLQLGTVIYQDLNFNKFAFTTQIGFYILKPYDYWFMFNRTGIRYLIYKNMFFQVNLKSHKFQADYIEWGLGVNL
jgi:hypothetical protein